MKMNTVKIPLAFSSGYSRQRKGYLDSVMFEDGSNYKLWSFFALIKTIGKHSGII